MQSYRHWKKGTLAVMILAAISAGNTVEAMPDGGVVQSGNGSIIQQGNNMTIRQDSSRLAMDWTQFNVNKGESVNFVQPGKGSLALNRVTGGRESSINGQLTANGQVLLVNPAGVTIGKNASIDVGGLVASTAQVSDNLMKNFGNSNGDFTLGNPGSGKIVNEGTIRAEGGLALFHASTVENQGTVTSEGGTVGLLAADRLNLSPDADGKLSFTVDGNMARASALNSGTLSADGGTVIMTAASADRVMDTVVNNTGVVEARALHTNQNGRIVLDGGKAGTVEVSGTLDASGQQSGQSGGDIKVIGQKTIVHTGTNLLAAGNVNGGKIETSGDVLNLESDLHIDAKGLNGKAGEWLLDPLDVIIAKDNPMNTENYTLSDKKTADSSDFTNGSASIAYNDPDATSANTSAVNSAVTWIDRELVQNMLNAGTNVTIQSAATNGSANIIVKDDITKTAGTEATLTLDAMRNITVNGKISSTADKLNVVLNADTDGNQIGVVIINADIDTNGGNFTSATGGTLKYNSKGSKGYGKGTFKEGGAPDPSGHTAGTYFGHVDASGTADGKRDDRLIRTHGGAITLNGEVAIGLGGGTLTLDSGGGNVNVTGIINSGNSYGSYVYGTTTWNELTQAKVDEYLASGMMPAYHYQGINYERKRVVKTDENGNPITDADGNPVYATDSAGNPVYATDANGKYIYLTDENGNYIVSTEKEYYTDKETHYTFTEQDSQNVRWPSDGTSTSVSTGAGYGYSSVIVSKGSMTTQEYLQYLAVSDPDSFLVKYMESGATISIRGTSYTLARATKNGVNYLGYKQGNSVVQLTTDQLKSLAYDAATRALNKDDTTTMKNGSSAYTNLVDNIRRLLASNWFESAELAKGDTGGGSAVNDSYLATITTILENSLTTPNGQQILWAGGMGSGVRNKTGRTNNDKQNPYSWYGLPDDPTHQNGMYWVTGPEGEANGGEGTQFYSNVNSNWQTQNYGETIYGYANWDTYQDKINKQSVTRYQPDNSAPFLTVGFGTTGKWDDAAFGGDTTIGFIKETNLEASSLNIQAGAGNVNLGGNIGGSKSLDTVNIESTGAVKIGADTADVTKYHYGVINANHGIYISGKTVSVGGEIHSGTTDTGASRSDIQTCTENANPNFQLDNVTITSSGNLTVHGITSSGYKDTTATQQGGKINLTSAGTDGTGAITLEKGVDYNGDETDGTLTAASRENGAVVIDAQGIRGTFVNHTQGTKAIDTKGTWQVYSASPEADTLGNNLNSHSDARWTAKSAANGRGANVWGNALNTYDDTSANRFVFQNTPTITVYAGEELKTYGDTLTADAMKNFLQSREEFTGLDGKLYNVTDYEQSFQEKAYTEYMDNADSITVSSDGAKATATRDGGSSPATARGNNDGHYAVYDMDVDLGQAAAKNGYILGKDDGTLELVKRHALISGTGSLTYGDTDGILKTWDEQQVQGLADGSAITYDVSIKDDSDYTADRGSRDTANAGTYADSVSFDNITIVDAEGNIISADANYDLTTTGAIQVHKARLTIDTDGNTREYGQAAEVASDIAGAAHIRHADTAVVNGDNVADILTEMGLHTTSDALVTVDGQQRTNHVGAYDLNAHFTDTSNYEVYAGTTGKEILTPKTIYAEVSGNGSDLDHISWQVTRNPESQLVNGDQGVFRYGIGPIISRKDQLFGVDMTMNGDTLHNGKGVSAYGNDYIFQTSGTVTLTFNPLVKPDVWEHGGYHPRDKKEISMPVFRVDDKEVNQYGTYSAELTNSGKKLRLSPTGMRLPEPTQIPGEERTYTTMLSTSDGSGEFRLVYNGVSLQVEPLNEQARDLVRKGDATKNVALTEAAIHTGFTQLGLDLMDLKGVYVYMN